MRPARAGDEEERSGAREGEEREKQKQQRQPRPSSTSNVNDEHERCMAFRPLRQDEADLRLPLRGGEAGRPNPPERLDARQSASRPPRAAHRRASRRNEASGSSRVEVRVKGRREEGAFVDLRRPPARRTAPDPDEQLGEDQSGHFDAKGKYVRTWKNYDKGRTRGEGSGSLRVERRQLPEGESAAVRRYKGGKGELKRRRMSGRKRSAQAGMQSARARGRRQERRRRGRRDALDERIRRAPRACRPACSGPPPSWRE